MAKIIREDFTLEEYSKMVNEFLFADSRVSLPVESLNKIREQLDKTATSFRKMFTCYFEDSGNQRFDLLSRRMESLAKRLSEYSETLSENEQEVYALFWKDIADKIETDYMEIKDQYLKNTCNYFLWEIGKLQTSQ